VVTRVFQPPAEQPPIRSTTTTFVGVQRLPIPSAYGMATARVLGIIPGEEGSARDLLLDLTQLERAVNRVANTPFGSKIPEEHLGFEKFPPPAEATAHG